jgi:hypothetical protein
LDDGRGDRSDSAATALQIENGRDISATLNCITKEQVGRWQAAPEAGAWKSAMKAARAISFVDTRVATKQMAMRVVDQLTARKSGDGLY